MPCGAASAGGRGENQYVPLRKGLLRSAVARRRDRPGDRGERARKPGERPAPALRGDRVALLEMQRRPLLAQHVVERPALLDLGADAVQALEVTLEREQDGL